MKQLRESVLVKVLFICTVIVNIKSVFLEYCNDSGYAVAMACRMLKGDRMLTEMWEPHQTSAFVMAGLIKVYESIFGTKEGVVVYLHFCGLVLFAVTAWFAVATLKKYIDKNVAYLMGLLLLNLRPKMVQIPDYANLSIIFSAWFFAFLIRYFLGKRKPISLVLASVFLCLNVLAYPSCIIMYVGLVVCILLYSEKKIRDIAISTGTCAVFGLGYLSYFLFKMNFSRFIAGVRDIFNADSHSGESIYTGFSYFEEFAIGLGVILLCIVFAKLTELLSGRLSKGKKSDFSLILSIYFAVFICLERILAPTLFAGTNIGVWCVDKIILFVVIVAGVFGYKYQNPEQKKIYVIGIIVSGGTFFATLLLTNLSFLTVFAYTHIAVMVSFMSISCMYKAQKEAEGFGRFADCLAIACLVIVIFSQGINSLDKVENYVRKGPLKGLVATLSECNKSRITYEDFNRLLDDRDVVLIAQEYNLDPLYYTYSDAGIGTFSTISTVSLGRGLENYWLKYPEKEPTVIVVPCWDGIEDSNYPEWLGKRIREEYTLSDVTDYWNFYRKE